MSISRQVSVAGKTALLAVLSPVLLGAEFVRPTIPATWRPGACDDGFHAPMQPFIRAGGAEIARRRTVLHFTWDREFLRIRVAASEIDMAAVRLAFARGRAERVRDDDSVSVFLRLSGVIYEFSVASDGRLDEVCWRDGGQDVAWTGGGTWSVERPNEWLGYLVVPWSALGIEPTGGEAIDFSSRRRSQPAEEVSGWPACVDESVPPQTWGALELIPDGSPYIGQFIPSRFAPGTCKMVHWVKPDGTRARLEILASAGGEPFALPLEPEYEGSGGGWWSYRYTIPPGAPLDVQVIMRVGAKVLHATAVLPVPMPLLTDELQAVQQRLARLLSEADAIRDQARRAAFVRAGTALRDELDELLKAGQAALADAPTVERAERLTEYCAGAERCAWRFAMLEGRHKALQTRGAAARRYAVGTTHGIRKLRRDDTDLDYGVPLRLRCARRERESGQIVIVPFDTPLANVRVTHTTLRGSGGAMIPAADVQVHLVGYVKTTPPDYDVDYVGWWPDPLMPPEPFGVPTHHTQPLWVTVYAGPDTAAGVYRGAARIDAGDAGTVDVPLEVEVLDYELPLRGRLRTIFGFDWNEQLVGWYGWDTPKFRPHEYKNIPQDWARQIWDMTLSYRIYAGGLYEWLRFPRAEDLDFCLERGLNNYQICLPEGKTIEDIPHMKRICADLRRRGIMDMAYVYAWDEGAEGNPNIRRTMIEKWSVLKKEIPDLTRADVYGKPTEEVMSVLDVVMPLTPELRHRERWDHWRERGHITGAYVCCGPRHPCANFFIDYPAIDQRILFWQLYDHKVTFFLYYLIDIWKHNLRQNPRWPDGPWITASHGNDNGDGHLVYPGRAQVLPSVRLANIRDGIEDYEALVVLEKLTANLDANADPDIIIVNERLLAMPDELSASISEYTKDPAVLMKWRRRLDEQILAAQAALR